jgi:hypothetical protein
MKRAGSILDVDYACQWALEDAWTKASNAVDATFTLLEDSDLHQINQVCPTFIRRRSEAESNGYIWSLLIRARRNLSASYPMFVTLHWSKAFMLL